MRTSVSRSVLGLVGDSVGSSLLALTHRGALRESAQLMVANDPSVSVNHIDAALKLVGATCSAVDVVEHQLFCGHRQAAWTLGIAEPLGVQIGGREWLEETIDHPTIFVSPMTLATKDALTTAAAVRQCMDGREVVFYGEDMDDFLHANPEYVSTFAGVGVGAVRRILSALGRSGVLVTYTDFVYAGHPCVETALFGRPRPVSASFVAIAGRPGTMLVPCLQRYSETGVRCEILEPVVIDSDDADARGQERRLRQLIVASVVGGILEQLIRLCPEQWCLLETLTAESPQMG